MRASSHIRAGELAFAVACLQLVLSACGGLKAGLGERCGSTDDCQDRLQCFDEVCTPLCGDHVDCGDGYVCQLGGECRGVESDIGEVCRSEIDCGPDQACFPDIEDGDGDDRLAGTCQRQDLGLPLGAECQLDAACQMGVCTLGHCSQMCSEPTDCPPRLICRQVPRILEDSSPRLNVCLSALGVIADDIPFDGTAGSVRIPVPTNAESFALVAEVDDPTQLVAVSKVTAPDGAVLYSEPTDPEQFFANPIRYLPGLGVSTLLVSNTPSVGLYVGVYDVALRTELPSGAPGTAVPRIRVLYKLDPAATLDLHFHFLDLESHPCLAETLDAGTAAASAEFNAYRAAIGTALEGGGVRVGDVTFSDIPDQPGLDGIDRDRAGELFALADQEIGVNVFLVRSLSPAGVEAVVGGTPGPPRSLGTPASGIAIGVDTLCYRDWAQLARITAHAVARQMGLFHNRDPAGRPDPIADSDELASNLLFFADTGGIQLSEGQGEVLRRYPGLR